MGERAAPPRDQQVVDPPGHQAAVGEIVGPLRLYPDVHAGADPGHGVDVEGPAGLGDDVGEPPPLLAVLFRDHVLAHYPPALARPHHGGGLQHVRVLEARDALPQELHVYPVHPPHPDDGPGDLLLIRLVEVLLVDPHPGLIVPHLAVPDAPGRPPGRTGVDDPRGSDSGPLGDLPALDVLDPLLSQTAGNPNVPSRAAIPLQVLPAPPRAAHVEVASLAVHGQHGLVPEAPPIHQPGCLLLQSFPFLLRLLRPALHILYIPVNVYPADVHQQGAAVEPAVLLPPVLERDAGGRGDVGVPGGVHNHVRQDHLPTRLVGNRDPPDRSVLDDGVEGEGVEQHVDPGLLHHLVEDSDHHLGIVVLAGARIPRVTLVDGPARLLEPGAHLQRDAPDQEGGVPAARGHVLRVILVEPVAVEARYEAPCHHAAQVAVSLYQERVCPVPPR